MKMINDYFTGIIVDGLFSAENMPFIFQLPEKYIIPALKFNRSVEQYGDAIKIKKL